MKKIATVTIMLLVLVGCQQSKYGQAGENAIQYVREQMNDQKDNIKSVEITMEDSVLSTILLSFATTELYLQNTKYLGDEISRDHYHAFVDSIDRMMTDVTRSWIMDREWNDSLKQLPKYKNSWRKAFMIEVTMKSNQTLTYRICMDQDGTTPSMTSDQFMKQRDELQQALSKRLDM